MNHKPKHTPEMDKQWPKNTAAVLVGREALPVFLSTCPGCAECFSTVLPRVKLSHLFLMTHYLTRYFRVCVLVALLFFPAELSSRFAQNSLAKDLKTQGFVQLSLNLKHF